MVRHIIIKFENIKDKGIILFFPQGEREDPTQRYKNQTAIRLLTSNRH